jgi:hypothetical protein
MTAQVDDDIPEVVRVAFWNWHMDGSPAAEIARYSFKDFLDAGLPSRECSSAEVRRVLSETPPQAVLDDLRHIHGVRAFWIAAGGELDGEMGAAPGMVFAFQPWKLTTRAFQKGIRAICRDFRENCSAGYIDPQVIEGIEMEAALRMIANRGVPAWVVSEDGEITRYSGEFSLEEGNGEALPTP